jgi:hypothetical protein
MHPPKLTVFVVHSPDRPKKWLQTCLESLNHEAIEVTTIKGVPTLTELLKLRLTLPSLATTKYMAFVDDDDWIDHTHITPMLEILETGNWGGIYSNENIVSQEGRIIGHRDSYMKIYDPLIHCRRLIDTHHLTIVKTELAQAAVKTIPTEYIYLEPLIYGLVGLMQPLVHYPHRPYFWRHYGKPTQEKLDVQNKATKNAAINYFNNITTRK